MEPRKRYIWGPAGNLWDIVKLVDWPYNRRANQLWEPLFSWLNLAPAWLKGPASLLIEMLAAIPSVIIGLWGLYVLVPVVRNPVENWLGNHLGSLPFFRGPPFGVGFLAAGHYSRYHDIPIITAVSRDAMRAVPNEQREAMFALGATRWEMINKAVLPYCRSGIIGAIILGIGRALGETMAVTMVIGNSYKLTASLFLRDQPLPAQSPVNSVRLPAVSIQVV